MDEADRSRDLRSCDLDVTIAFFFDVSFVKHIGI